MLPSRFSALAPQTLRLGTDYVLHAILDFIVDGYLPLAQTIEDHVLNMEQRMLDAFLERDQITRIFRLRQEVILFQRVIGPMSEMCGKLVHLELPVWNQEAKRLFPGRAGSRPPRRGHGRRSEGRHHLRVRSGAITLSRSARGRSPVSLPPGQRSVPCRRQSPAFTA